MKNFPQIITKLIALWLTFNCLHAQTPENKDHPNFFGLGELLPGLIEDPDEGRIGDYEKIMADRKITTFRRYFPREKIVAEEYIRIENDTFLYISYFKPKHEIASKGKLVPSICCAFTDTVYYTDPETHEEKFTLEKYWNWSKEGKWEIRKNGFYEYGHFKNNLKTGEWYVWDVKNQMGSYVYYDDAGKIKFKDPENLVYTKNRARILQGMYGPWTITHVNEKDIALIQGDYYNITSYEGLLIFEKDTVSVKPKFRCWVGGIDPTIKSSFKNTWSMDDEFVLVLNVWGFENKKYRLDFLNRYQMRLVLVE